MVVKKRIKSILLAYDGLARQESLAPALLALAQQHGASLHIVNVVPEVPRRSWRASGISAVELQAALVATRRFGLESLAAPARAMGLDVHTKVRVGDAAEELIREAMALDAGLLVVTDEPQLRDASRAFGTTTMKLLRACPCPVWAMRASSAAAIRTIVAAVDLDPEGRSTSMGRRILEAASTLARISSARFLVFHAWSLWGEELLHGRADVAAAELGELVEATRQSEMQRLQALVARQDIRNLKLELLVAKGEPERLLPAVVSQHDVDVVVMGTACRRRLSGLVLGNTAERLLNRLGCSVVVVKPEGFVSPVAQVEEGQATRLPAVARRSKSRAQRSPTPQA